MRIRITHPGVRYLDFKQLNSGAVSRIECTVLDTLYGHKDKTSHDDIAILDAGSYISGHIVPLSLILPSAGEVLDIVGYPGQITTAWLGKHDAIDNVDLAKPIADKLLPDRTLIASRGRTESVSTLIHYHLSTSPGMSGGCVVYKGKVIGAIIPLQLYCSQLH